MVACDLVVFQHSVADFTRVISSLREAATPISIGEETGPLAMVPGSSLAGFSSD